MTEQTARERLREWVRQQIDGVSTVKLPDLADRGVAHFSGDAAFLGGLFRDQLRGLVYDTAQSVFTKTRGSLIVLGDEAVTKEELRERAERLRSRWENWLEHTGDRHMTLLAMTKADLKLAADERRHRADAELAIARLWDALAARLKEDQKVGDVFTAEQIEAEWLAATRRPTPTRATKKEAA